MEQSNFFKNIRKLLVKLFVLDYTFEIGGTRLSGSRAGAAILPLFILSGILGVSNPDYPNPYPFLWFCYGITLLALFFGFVYFRIKPAQWEELDDQQKIQAGYFLKLNLQQHVEWINLRNKYNFNN